MTFGRIKTLSHAIDTQVLRHFSSSSLLEVTPPRLLPHVNLAFAGQSLVDLELGLARENISFQPDGPYAQEVRTILCTIENGYFFVGPEVDGLVANADRTVHPLSTMFLRQKGVGGGQDIDVDFEINKQFDEIFVGFDAIWGNYFHFLNFALAKSFLAKKALGRTVRIALPDYAEREGEHRPAFSRSVYHQAIELAGLTPNVEFLPPGAYAARKLHYIFTAPVQPTALLFTDGHRALFDEMRRHARRSESAGDNVHLVRGKASANRISDDASLVMGKAAREHGFVERSFENLDLVQQISTIAFARKLISPHGAGLTNSMFHPGGLKLLEINRRLDGGDSGYRTFFYIMAAGRGYEYFTLDSDDDAHQPDRAVAAMQAMDGAVFSEGPSWSQPPGPIRAAETENRALNCAATQSSICEFSFGQSVEEDAGFVVNGDTETDYGCHTECEDSPWWMVDLGERIEIECVNIYNRKGILPLRRRLLPCAIELSDDAENWTIAHTLSSMTDLRGNSDDAGPYQWFADFAHSARYVRIRILKNPETLHLAEVQIHGRGAGDH